MTWRPWVRAFREALFGDAPVMAGGVALFALIATIPGLAAIVTIYSLVADSADIARHLAGLDQLFPREVVGFVIGQLEREAARSSRELGLALATTLVLALYLARSAADAMRVGLNRIYGVDEGRPKVRQILLALGVAATVLLGVVALIAVIVALRAVLAVAGAGDAAHAIAAVARWPLLLVVMTLGLAALYRAVPSPREHRFRHVWTGALVGTALWLAASFGLSVWVGRVADYENVYGAFASVLVVVLWFYVSALCVLLGGLVNAELEKADAGRAATAPPA